MDKAWYANLRKPQWTPEPWVFGPVWSALYLAQGVALARIVSSSSPNVAYAVSLFAVQFCLNLLWTPTFFGKKKTKEALSVLRAMCILAVATGLAFYSIDSRAGLLFVPYVLWLFVALNLNAFIVDNN